MRVVIAEDSVLLRTGLVRLLQDEGIEVAGEAGDGEELVAAAREHRPDLCLVDVRMPPGFSEEGMRAALEIRRTLPEVAVVMFSQHVVSRYAAELLGSGAGKIGYLLKDRVVDVDQFVETLHRVAGGGTAIDPEVVAQLLTRNRNDDKLGQLSPRELEVLSLMAQGLNNSGIAARLVVTERAVEKHIRGIFIKLDLGQDDFEHRRVLAVLEYLKNHS
ncbi:response regulator transcription factor [Allonocardiopsis opalescens]|uniref:LuxR family two component transcriptional regulator n=1 Tax=Allonocardiopsis opalescens TaxID=1144618 RepID=A0A2T0QAX4_9ACTN|nr:response regulator transcription factor [Allonocardiopsis opalescens]PRY00961.1 LuxR family two component transcriptional regulator [Allonocardiopsis opalescens]